MKFELLLNTQVRFGAGCSKEIPPLLVANKFARVGIVVDCNLVDVEPVSGLITAIKKQADCVVVGQCSVSEPSYDALEEMRDLYAHDDLQVIIGIGGGSALDMAKAMAVLVQNKEPAIHYRGFNKMAEPVLPVIAVPTTAGTGSEVTPNASFVDSIQKVKMGINGEAVRPRYAFLDPELTLSCPRAPTLSAALDSLVHATEAFVAKKSNPIARLFAREGFQCVFDSLAPLMEEPHRLHLREKVMYGAFLSGIGLMHSGTGPAAALSYPLGVHYGVPHGLAGAIFLPHVVSYNIESGVYDYAELIDWLPEESDRSIADKAKWFSDKLFTQWDVLGVPKQLADLSINVERDLMVHDTLQLQAALEQNPVPFGKSEIENVLTSLGG